MAVKNPKVSVVMGSNSDWPTMKGCVEMLEKFGLCCELQISSAHRSPEQTALYASQAADRGIEVIIAAAGMAAHLAGVIAANTTLPVIGVPMNSGPLQGIDALLSTVQMPPGVPVATVGIGPAGAKNAALLAIQILAVADKKLVIKLSDYKDELAQDIEKKNQILQEEIK